MTSGYAFWVQKSYPMEKIYGLRRKKVKKCLKMLKTFLPLQLGIH